MGIKNTFAQNLARFRKEKKITQREMAQLLQDRLKTPVSDSSISHWEKGDYVPSVDVVFAYCDILNVSADDIYGIDNLREKTPAECLQLALEKVGISYIDFKKLSKEEVDTVLQTAKSLVNSFLGRK